MYVYVVGCWKETCVKVENVNRLELNRLGILIGSVTGMNARCVGYCIYQLTR